MKFKLVTYLCSATVFTPLSHALELIGKTTSKNPVSIVSEISGVVDHAQWQIGDAVKEGSSLVTIKDQDFKLEVRRQQANVALVKADLDIKQFVYSRYKELRAKNSLSQNELDVALANYRAAKASLALAKLELEKATLELENTQVSSQINGFIVERSVDNGAWVNQGDPLYKLSNIDQLNVRLLASEFDLPALFIGQPIQLWSEAQPQHRIDAHINRIGVEIDPTTFAYFVEVEIDNKQHLFKPGMSIHATTEFGTHTHIGNPNDVISAHYQ